MDKYLQDAVSFGSKYLTLLIMGGADLKGIFKYFPYCYVNFLPIYLSISVHVSLQVEFQTHASWTRATVIISGDMLIINLKSPFQPLGQ